MSRDDGFPVADVSTTHLDDPKVKALWRSLRDSDAMCVALTVHQAVVLASWGAGHRVTAEEAAPIWLELGTSVEALVSVGLLDRQHRLPKRAWDAWYGPAEARRGAAREAGREGNRRRWNKDPMAVASGSDRVAIGSLSPTVRPTNKPSVPSVRARVTAERAADVALEPLGEILRRHDLDPTIARKSD